MGAWFEFASFCFPLSYAYDRARAILILATLKKNYFSTSTVPLFFFTAKTSSFYRKL